MYVVKYKSQHQFSQFNNSTFKIKMLKTVNGHTVSNYRVTFNPLLDFTLEFCSLIQLRELFRQRLIKNSSLTHIRKWGTEFYFD